MEPFQERVTMRKHGARSRSPNPPTNTHLGQPNDGCTVREVFDDGFERPLSVYQCRSSVTEYHLRPMTPVDVSTSNGSLDSFMGDISNPSSNRNSPANLWGTPNYGLPDSSIPRPSPVHMWSMPSGEMSDSNSVRAPTAPWNFPSLPTGGITDTSIRVPKTAWDIPNIPRAGISSYAMGGAASMWSPPNLMSGGMSNSSSSSLYGSMPPLIWVPMDEMLTHEGEEPHYEPYIEGVSRKATPNIEAMFNPDVVIHAADSTTPSCPPPPPPPQENTYKVEPVVQEVVENTVEPDNIAAYIWDCDTVLQSSSTATLVEPGGSFAGDETFDDEDEDGGLADSLSSVSIHKAMASPRAKSPRPVTPKKEEKDESFWDKFGTLGRKKRIKEVQAFEEEGKNAIDSPGSPTSFDIPPEEYDLAEGEERSLIERRSYADPKLQQLTILLIDWINDELADQRIIVKSIEDDVYDGQVLQKLLEKLTGQKLEVPEVTQSEEGQRHKLQIVLGAANQVLGLPRWSPSKWSVDSIHSKSLVAILYLLVHLVRHFRAPLRLPENVNVETVVVKKKNGKLEYRRVTEEITSTYDEFGMRCERDAFDALLDHAPDKLQVVKKSLITFVNKHLNKVNLEVSDIDNQFHDGVYLTLLMGLLEGYFVPFYEFHLTPKDFEQKVFNVSFAFELMQDAGLSKPKARPEDIVNLDLKSTLRVLYNLFAKYKNLG